MKVYLRNCLFISLWITGSCFGYPNPIDNQTNVVVTNVWDLSSETLYLGGVTESNTLTIGTAGNVTAEEIQINSDRNELSVLNGGQLTTDGGPVLSTGNNTISISGEGSVWTNSSDSADPTNLGASLNASQNQMIISDGGALVHFDEIELGSDPSVSGDKNLFSVRGDNTVLDIYQISIGGTSNQVDVSNGAGLNLAQLWMNGDASRCTVDGTGTLFEISQELNIMNAGAHVAVTNGGALSTFSLYVDADESNIDVLGGGQLTLQDDIYFETDNNLIQVSGEGSSLSNTTYGSVYFGDSSDVTGNQLIISDGASMNDFDSIYLGGWSPFSSNNLLSIQGSNTTCSVYGVSIGGTSNRFEVAEGAGSLDPMSLPQICSIFGEYGILDIHDPGTEWWLNELQLMERNPLISVTNGATLRVNQIMQDQYAINTTFNILGGGQLISSSDMLFGTDNNLITISGDESALKGAHSNQIFSFGDGINQPGAASDNRLIISDGGIFESFSMVLIGGTGDSLRNVLSVNGNNTIVQLDSVGILGSSNRIEVTDGALVEMMYLDMPGTENTLDVKGAGSRLYVEDLYGDKGGTARIELSASHWNYPGLVFGQYALQGGVLDVVMPLSLSPQLGDLFHIIDWAGPRLEAFTAINLPALSFGLTWDTSNLYTQGTIEVFKGGDSDDDGMDDSWELDTFGKNVDPDDDPDNDGQTNLDEYIAGTEPLNPDSYFKLTNFVPSDDGFIVQWPSISNRVYEVFWAQSLTHQFNSYWPLIEAPQNCITDTLHSATSTGFYQIEVHIKPDETP